jgi:hypothetical protein
LGKSSFTRSPQEERNAINKTYGMNVKKILIVVFIYAETI